MNLSYGGFTLGGSFRRNVQNVKNGGLAYTPNPDGIVGVSLNGHAWDAGLVHASGPWAAGVSYYGSKMDGYGRTNWGNKEIVSFVQASAKYDLGPGVSLQGLVGYGSYHASTTTSTRHAQHENRGYTALSGVAISF